MKSNRWVAFAAVTLLVVGVLTVWGPSSPGQPPTPQSATAWEYRFVELRGLYVNEFEKTFNDMGKEGWEYCEIRDFTKMEDPQGQKIIRRATFALFKRPTNPAPEPVKPVQGPTNPSLK